MGDEPGRFIVRALDESELPDMLELWRESGLPYRPSGRDGVDELRRQLVRSPDLFVGAFSGARLIGAAIASDDGRKGWINRLAVLPGYRRMGVGTALVKECEEALRRRGRGVFAILIEGENEGSEQLFLRSGYKDEREIRYYVKRTRQDL